MDCLAYYCYLTKQQLRIEKLHTGELKIYAEPAPQQEVKPSWLEKLYDRVSDTVRGRTRD